MKNKIFIYAGPGASAVSLLHTKYTLRGLLVNSYDIEELTPQKIKQGEWEARCALFVVPGGSDLLYLKSLSPEGNNKIRRYVENGGAYLGLCAGAYYAADKIEFARGTPLEIIGERELKFFPGRVEGPVLASYDYYSYSGCRIANVQWTGGRPFTKLSLFSLFYNGGGYFVEATSKPNTLVLASYITDSALKPAIIEILHGKGKVMLSGVHWEYNPTLLESGDPYLKNIIPQLTQAYPQTVRLARHLLDRLGLKIA